MDARLEMVRVTAAGVPELAALSRQTFADAFAAVNTAEDMRAYLENNLSEAAIAAQLETPGTEFYFAKLGNATVGYLKLNAGSAQTELKNKGALELERIYILKEQQGRGLGKQLMAFTLERAREIKAPYLWLGVWEHNPGAIRLYRRLGFVEFDRHIFMLGADQQTDIMMKLEEVVPAKLPAKL